MLISVKLLTEYIIIIYALGYVVVTKTRNDPQRPTTIHNDPQRSHNNPQRPTAIFKRPGTILKRPTTIPQQKKPPKKKISKT